MSHIDRSDDPETLSEFYIKVYDSQELTIKHRRNGSIRCTRLSAAAMRRFVKKITTRNAPRLQFHIIAIAATA